MSLQIAGIIRESITDGPGIRFVLFLQGCPHHCPGCHNPQTWDLDGGKAVLQSRILEEIDKNPLLKGVTFSGGEPILQSEGLVPLAQKIKDRGLDLILYTGYTYEELSALWDKKPAVQELVFLCDYIIDGRFVLKQRNLSLPYRGSENQRIIDVAQTRKQGKIVCVEL